jgi:PIN domain nuclease of toxin-antitoxin system
LLVEKKRIELHHDMGEWVQQSVRELDLQEAPFTSAVAHELRFTLLGHRDPGDRFLVATARVYDLTLVTADQRLQQIPGLQHLANR